MEINIRTFHTISSRLSGVFIVLLILGSTQAFSQLQVRQLKKNTERTDSFKDKLGARTKQPLPLPLPFFDDFSRPFINTPHDDLYPDTARWENSFTIWINGGMAINAPTINVATFDGLDSAGRAYSPNDIFLNGFTDSLVSKKINLSDIGANPVSVVERNSVYISFFYQWRGNGEAPDEDDYLELQFKNDLNEWENALTIAPDLGFQRDIFYTAIVKIEGTQFFHKDFQFQIRSFGRESGPFDTWNVDYIYLNKGRNANDLSFPDRAAASPISPLFKPYTAMPYDHFLASKKLDSVRFDVKNLKNEQAATNYKADITYEAFQNGSSTTFSKILKEPSTVAPFGLDPYGRKEIKLDTLPDVDNPMEFNPDADSLDITLTITILSGDFADNIKPAFEPIDFRINDTIRQTYNLRNFYAYDDGVAEYAAGLIEPGNLVAYEFHLPADLDKSTSLLDSIRVYFPPFGLSSNQTVDFFIFHENQFEPGKPGNVWLRIPSFKINNAGINQFQSVKFLPSLLINEPKFYIGWKQPISGDVLVGLDNSNDTGSKLFVNTDGNAQLDEKTIWNMNTLVIGSLMIRPFFSKGVVDPKTGIEEELKFAIYPNPSQGNFYVDGDIDSLEVRSITGQIIPVTTERDQERMHVQLNAAPGLYILRCSKGVTIRTHKILITH